MIYDYGLKPLDDESIKFLEELYQKLTAQRRFCYFCQGGNNCRCGQCPEFEYHDMRCLVNLLGWIISDYRRRSEKELPSLMLTTVEEMTWYRNRVKELEEQLGIEDD